jgi:SAM-dependent methyltransferase
LPGDAGLTGIELSPAMLALARQRAAGVRRAVDLHTGDAEHRPYDTSASVTVVCALSPCTIPDPATATATGEMKPVATPGRASPAARPHRQLPTPDPRRAVSLSGSGPNFVVCSAK